MDPRKVFCQNLECPARGKLYGLRLRLHEGRERYTESSELVEVTRRGEHGGSSSFIYHARAYILLPDITITVGLWEPGTDGSIGEVLSSEFRGVRPVEIGNAQDWYYPEDRTLVLWECLLVERSPGVRRIVTPVWEPVYEQPAWQLFLSGLGYEGIAQEAFDKELVATP